MLLHHLKSDFYTRLHNLYPKTEITSFFYRLCEFKLSLKRVDIALNLDKKIALKEVSFFEDATKRLKLFEPIQYIIGTTEFYGLTFKVDKNVLIPRPETEELVSWILKEDRGQRPNHNVTLSEVEGSQSKFLRILDIGTGSGCIAITLAKNLPQAEVWALDISKKALKMTQQNAELNNVNIKFIETNILKLKTKNIVIASEARQSLASKEITRPNVPLRYGQAVVAKLLCNDIRNDNNVIPTERETSDEESLFLNFDIIVSNPPYVKQNEKQLMQQNVLNHEPHLALFVADDNPLIFYNKIADFAKNTLAKNGLLFFEINQSLGKEVITMLKQKGFKNTELKKDIFEVDRMIKAYKN